MTPKTSLIAIAIATTCLATPAFAGPITGTGQPTTNPSLGGATVVDFEGATLGTSNSKTFGGLTITGTSTVDNIFGGQYNTFGTQYLQNNQGVTTTLVFTFANAVSAFGFNLGAADLDWTLTAGGQTYTFAPTFSANDKNFYGIDGLNATTATLTFSAGDYVLIDNISYKVAAAGAVPEPATWGMMIAGFGMMGAAMRTRRRSTKVSFA